MKVLITGANGFLGQSLCEAAAKRGHAVHALVRQSAPAMAAKFQRHEGTFHDPSDAERILAAAAPDAVIHAAAVISTGRPDPALSMKVNVEGTRTLADATQRSGCTKWVQISSMSAHASNRSVYGSTKFLADEIVRASGLDWTIVRPSLIYGSRPQSIFHKLAKLIQRLPVVPMIGNGKEPIRPVHADDLANAVVSAIEKDSTIGQVYQLGGPEDWTFHDVVRAVAAAVGADKKPTLPVPLLLCRPIAAVCEALLSNPPITSDNIEGVAKAQPIDIASALRDLDFSPREFSYDPKAISQ